MLNTLKKHGFRVITKMSQLNSTQNICYFNYRTNQVNKYVHKKLIKAPKNTTTVDNTQYWKDLELVLKSQKNKINGIRLFINYTYQITSINNKQFTVRDPVENISVTTPIEMMDRFKLPYASTCHSVQGLSIDGPVTIFDVNTPHVDRYFVWTALTRATDFSNVTIFEHSESEIQTLQSCKIKQYFQGKVNGYKHQDKIAIREWKPSDYVTVDWINDTYSSMEVCSCIVCKTPYEAAVTENGTVTSNITVDRIDNTKAHTKDNIRLCCVTCNVTKGNRY